MIKQQKQHGMTLIEILISMVIGAFLIGGILQIFLNSKQTYRMQENLSRMQENGRFALDFISRDVRMAGYLGCFSETSTSPQFENLLNSSIAIRGYDNVASSFSIFNINNVVPNTDVVIVRSLSSAEASLVDPYVDPNYPNPSEKFFVDPIFNNDCPSNNSNGCHIGEILMVTDCSQAALFQATNITPAGGKLTIEHSVDNAFTPGNTSPATFSNPYSSGSRIVKLNTFGYYIRINPNNQPSLYRSKINQPSIDEELIEGIENMQIRYGVDTDDDGVANYYVDAEIINNSENNNSSTPPTPPLWSQVISVKVKLLVVSPDDNLTAQPVKYSFNGEDDNVPTDRRLRREFSSTIVLRNRLP